MQKAIRPPPCTLCFIPVLFENPALIPCLFRAKHAFPIIFSIFLLTALDYYDSLYYRNSLEA